MHSKQSSKIHRRGREVKRRKPLKLEYILMRIDKAKKKINPAINGYVYSVLKEIEEYLGERSERD